MSSFKQFQNVIILIEFQAFFFFKIKFLEAALLRLVTLLGTICK